ncbi:MAG TPA: nuclear transport factor 2 family protein, partial [Acidimicrobiales bacterium]|nr:nuclear transport factor 2 family protein [Acidimicrobiales bacterium]
QKFSAIEPGQASYLVHGDTVIVHSTDALTVEEGGQQAPGPTPSRVLEVWVRAGDSWVLAASDFDGDQAAPFSGGESSPTPKSVDTSQSAGETSEAAVSRLSGVLFDAMRAGDISAMAAVLSDDFRRVPPPTASTTSKAQWLSIIESAPTYYAVLDVSSDAYHEFGNCVVEVAQIKVGETPLRLLLVWVEEDGRWSLGALHGNVAV